MRPFDEMDQRAVAAMRVLAVDEVEQARSGHPGMPLGASPMAYVLWSRFLRHDPADPAWPDRDRFVLSAGHASAMLYALLHLFGYGLPIEELKRFRQWGSKTPGHPEHGLTPGVETTTGPLGQGLATAVGMALAERHLAARFNRDGMPVVGHRTWVIASDGDMMEGISHEAASLAGHLRLGRLTVLYDDNRVTIEGSTDLAFSEDVEARFAAYGWRTFHVDDGNDLAAIAAALEQAAAAEDAPALVRVRTHIGWASPKQDSCKAHGEPLGPEAAAATRAALGWTIAEPFVTPEEIRRRFREHGQRGAALHGAWVQLLARYRQTHPADAAELERRLAGELPAGWDEALPSFPPGSPLATRQASGKTLNALAPRLPELFGGAGDLAPSTDTLLAGEASVARGSYEGRNLHFGIREHAMAAAANGVALHGGMRAFVATFFVFSDYLRPAMRLAALMKLPVTYVFTHDSIGLGEDGPTHQPVEHMVALRVIPNMVALRPGDANETVQAWRVALERRDGPTALVLTRQKLPVLPPPPAGARGARRVRPRRGGMRRARGRPDRHRVRARTGARGARGAGGARPRDPRRLGAVSGTARPPERRLPARGARAPPRPTRRGRGRARPGVAPLGRRRRDRQPEPVRRLGAGSRGDGPPRVRRRGRGCPGHRRPRRPPLVADRGERARRRCGPPPTPPANACTARAPPSASSPTTTACGGTPRPRPPPAVWGGSTSRAVPAASCRSWSGSPPPSPPTARGPSSCSAWAARASRPKCCGRRSARRRAATWSRSTPPIPTVSARRCAASNRRRSRSWRSASPARRRRPPRCSRSCGRGSTPPWRSAPAAVSWRSRSPTRRLRAWPASGGSARCWTTPWTSAGATRRFRRWASSRRCGSGRPRRNSSPPASALSRASATATPPWSWRS